MEKLRLELKENNKKGIKRRAVTSAHTHKICAIILARYPYLKFTLQYRKKGL